MASPDLSFQLTPLQQNLAALACLYQARSLANSKAVCCAVLQDKARPLPGLFGDRTGAILRSTCGIQDMDAFYSGTCTADDDALLAGQLELKVTEGHVELLNVAHVVVGQSALIYGVATQIQHGAGLAAGKAGSEVIFWLCALRHAIVNIRGHLLGEVPSFHTKPKRCLTHRMAFHPEHSKKQPVVAHPPDTP